MSKIKIRLHDARPGHHGERATIIEEPHVRLPKAKIKNMLKSELREEKDGVQQSLGPRDATPENTYVSHVNWKSRLEKGDPY